jgi:threonine aldolase
VARAAGLVVHLDGARLMNACTASGRAPSEYAALAETVSICFSKGLGAPVGSAVAGSAELIERAHRARKMLGGGMRQAGVLAAAALFALERNVARLAQDHARAARLAAALAELPGVTIDPRAVETNIVYFDVDPGTATAAELCQALRAEGIWMLPIGLQRVRAVTHLGVTEEGITRAIERMTDVLERATGGR